MFYLKQNRYYDDQKFLSLWISPLIFCSKNLDFGLMENINLYLAAINFKFEAHT